MQPGQRHEERGPLCRRGAANGLQRRRPRCISFRQRYSNDGPGFFNLTLTTATDVVFRNRFQERVKMTFDGSSPIVSRLSNWHSRPQGPRKNDFSFRGALGAVPSKLWRVAARFSDCASIITLVGASRSSINRLKS